MGIVSNRSTWTAGLVLAILVLPGLGAVTAVAAAAGPGLAPHAALYHSGPSHTATQSTNWAGYAVTGANHSVSYVHGSWIEPSAVSCPSKGYQYSSFWVGIDGYSSSTVEQTGTDTDCQAGVAAYYAWYEFYPNPSFVISKVPIHAGDTISAAVKYVNSTVGFRVTLTDVTTGKSASHSAKVAGALRNS
ncbi:MAG: G1 family endopeptidase, partial [Thermoplasmata archaeon]|nr:G1 family endopeptidase [Thermoplasmata archaeon]